MQRRTSSGPGSAKRPTPARTAASRATGSGTTRVTGQVRAGGRPAARDTAGRSENRRTGAVTGRPSSRPAAARRTAATRTAAPGQRRLSGRACVLLVVLAALALGYTYPVRVYLGQKAEIAKMRAHQRQQQQTIVGLQEQVQAWQDPAYIATQARRRFYFVKPGERPLLSWEPDEAPQPATGTAARQRTPSWSDTLWSSIGSANQAPRS